jgi:hypothetical protein
LSLLVHNDAAQDLRALRDSDADAFAKLVALIQQLQKDAVLRSRLLDHGFAGTGDEPISIMKWLGAQKVERLPLWRLKFWDLERQGLLYRILYIYHWPDATFYVLAVVRREKFNYDDPNDPIRKRIVATCRRDFPGA